MNIFILDRDINKCVQYISDKHCPKMILETAQILCSPFERGKAPYRRTHYNHPCTIWARTSKQNYEWLLEYGIKLSHEHLWRFSNKKMHKSFEVINWCSNNYETLTFPQNKRTEFVLATDNKNFKDPVEGYRFYYLTTKKHLAVWKKLRKPPWWFNEDYLSRILENL